MNTTQLLACWEAWARGENATSINSLSLNKGQSNTDIVGYPSIE
jgi:hypothetical protein